MLDLFHAISRLDLTFGWHDYAEMLGSVLVLPVIYLVIRFILARRDSTYKRRLNLWGATAILMCGVGLRLCLLHTAAQVVLMADMTGLVTQTFSLAGAKNIVCKADPAKLQEGELAEAVAKLRSPGIVWKTLGAPTGVALAANADIPCDRIVGSIKADAMQASARDAALVGAYLGLATIVTLSLASLLMLIALLRASGINFSWPSLRKGSGFLSTRAPSANGNVSGSADESARW